MISHLNSEMKKVFSFRSFYVVNENGRRIMPAAASKAAPRRVKLPDSGTAVGLRASKENSLECSQFPPPPAQTLRTNALLSPCTRSIAGPGEIIACENRSSPVIALLLPLRFAKSSENRPNWLIFRAVFRYWKERHVEDPCRFCRCQ